MRIAVIDDKKEELEKAEVAVKKAGHECISILAGKEPLGLWINRIMMADVVITDLHFDARPDNPHGSNPEAPSGLLVALHAIAGGIPVVVCTQAFQVDSFAGHHGKALSWIYDGYVAYSGETLACPFRWEESKNWEWAVKMAQEM